MCYGGGAVKRNRFMCRFKGYIHQFYASECMCRSCGVLKQSRCVHLAIFLCFELIFKNPSGLITVDSDHLCAGWWRLAPN